MPDTKLSGKSVLMVIPHTQFRDEEFFEPRKMLEDSGATVVIASGAVRTCHSMNGKVVESAITIADAKPDDYHGIVLCGGTSVPDFFWNDKKLQELVSAMSAAGKVVASISLSTVVLAKAKLLANRDANVYFLPQAIQELKNGGATYVKDRLLVHGKMILAEGPPESAIFGQAICAALAS